MIDKEEEIRELIRKDVKKQWEEYQMKKYGKLVYKDGDSFLKWVEEWNE